MKAAAVARVGAAALLLLLLPFLAGAARAGNAVVGEDEEAAAAALFLGDGEAVSGFQMRRREISESPDLAGGPANETEEDKPKKIAQVRTVRRAHMCCGPG